MAAVTLTFSTPVINTGEATNVRRRIVLPDACVLRIYCASAATYLEFVDAADASARGAAFETIPAGTIYSKLIRRGEVAISNSGDNANVELHAERVA